MTDETRCRHCGGAIEQDEGPSGSFWYHADDSGARHCGQKTVAEPADPRPSEPVGEVSPNALDFDLLRQVLDAVGIQYRHAPEHGRIKAARLIAALRTRLEREATAYVEAGLALVEAQKKELLERIARLERERIITCEKHGKGISNLCPFCESERAAAALAAEREAQVAALRAGYDYLHTWLEVDGSLCFCRSTREELAAQLGQHLIYCEQVRSFLNDTASLAHEHDTRVIREARKQMKLEAYEAICPGCVGHWHDVERAVFQRDVTGEWAHRWLEAYGHGSRLCAAASLRALPDDPPSQEKRSEVKDS